MTSRNCPKLGRRDWKVDCEAVEGPTWGKTTLAESLGPSLRVMRHPGRRDVTAVSARTRTRSGYATHARRYTLDATHSQTRTLDTSIDIVGRWTLDVLKVNTHHSLLTTHHSTLTTR